MRGFLLNFIKWSRFLFSRLSLLLYKMNGPLNTKISVSIYQRQRVIQTQGT
ncbi:hypothetical protein VCRA2119O48_110028 [Vibrio crassostreae]|nr:hypothetical protein VCRA2119O48_110028 [Vibrio crassostreae]